MKDKLPYANKDLGQHFLRDQGVISAITDDIHDECEAIIEVGPGPAILTEILSLKERPLFLIEKDLRFKEYYEPLIPMEQVYFGDGLEVELPSQCEQWGIQDKNIWLVSNLPYNVSVPLTLKFTLFDSIKRMTLMYQKEVAEKIFATNPKKIKMGSLMALTQTYFDVSFLKKVPPGAFVPPPKVESAVLTFERKSDPTVPLSEFKAFEAFLRTLFLHKRKQIGNLLKGKYSKEVLDEALAGIGQTSQCRAEGLDLSQIQALYKALVKDGH
jgi:16S rRNA (adenine1518-N6/adenine1519-N6)-dimethyltransferase